VPRQDQICRIENGTSLSAEVDSWHHSRVKSYLSSTHSALCHQQRRLLPWHTKWPHILGFSGDSLRTLPACADHQELLLVLKDHDRLLGDTEIGRCAETSRPSCLGFPTILQEPQSVLRPSCPSTCRTISPGPSVLPRPAHRLHSLPRNADHHACWASSRRRAPCRAMPSRVCKPRHLI